MGHGTGSATATIVLLAQLRRPLPHPIRIDPEPVAHLVEAEPAGPVHNFVRGVLEGGSVAVVRGFGCR